MKVIVVMKNGTNPLFENVKGFTTGPNINDPELVILTGYTKESDVTRIPIAEWSSRALIVPDDMEIK